MRDQAGVAGMVRPIPWKSSAFTRTRQADSPAVSGGQQLGLMGRRKRTRLRARAPECDSGGGAEQGGQALEVEVAGRLSSGGQQGYWLRPNSL